MLGLVADGVNRTRRIRWIIEQAWREKDFIDNPVIKSERS
jgi:hypothetical protein